MVNGSSAQWRAWCSPVVPISSVNDSNAYSLITLISLVTAIRCHHIQDRAFLELNGKVVGNEGRTSRTSQRRSSVKMKNRAGNINRIIMNVYFRLRSDFLNWSSQLGPQNSLSNEIGVAHIMQCLCLGIEWEVSSFLRYLDIMTVPLFVFIVNKGCRGILD